jgi:hypothetical protein
MRARNCIPGLLLLALLGGPGCYTGFAGSDHAADGAGDDAADGAGDDEGNADDDGGDTADVEVAPSGLGRLTRIEYQRTVTQIFGEALAADVDFENLPADGRIGRFESNADLAVNIDSVDAYRLVAEDAGEAAGARATELLGCEESPECVAAFITTYGRRVYRRALNDAEVEVFVQFWDAMRSEGDLADAMRLTVTAFLQTPDFLYRLEKGEPGDDGDVRRLTGEEVASRLSYFLWRSGPDDALLDAAEADELDTPEGVLAHAERMLADPRADDTLVRFHIQWLGIDALETQLVDLDRFPEYEALSEDMLDETRRFVLHVFREDDATLATLFTADYSFASPELAAFYGAGVESSGDEGQIALDGRQRRGLLTQASYLTSHARSPERAAIYRGRSLLVDVFCQQLVPPDNVDTAIEFDTTRPAREQIEGATAGPACAGCHQLINPLGFLFENYDGIGGWRTQDGEYPVDAAAEVLGTDIDGEYANATELMLRLGDSPLVAACVARQWMRFALSRPEGPEDETSITEAYENADGDLRAMIGAITQTDVFRHRRLPAP